MFKKAFKMKVYPEQQEEYEKRHNQLWPEMREMFAEYGAVNYSIFLDPDTNYLFGYLEIEDEKRWAESESTEINQKWWDYMEDIMETNPNNSSVSKNLKQVFEL